MSLPDRVISDLGTFFHSALPGDDVEVVFRDHRFVVLCLNPLEGDE